MADSTHNRSSYESKAVKGTSKAVQRTLLRGMDKEATE